MSISIPLSASGPAEAFAVVLEAHRAALEAHCAGKPGVAAPAASALVAALVSRVPRGDPHPDAFVIVPYEIVDDTPRSPEEQRQIDVLRETLGP